MQQTIFHLKKKDLVQVMTGKERGKTGKVLRVDHKHGRVTVEKLNMIKRHTKATGKSASGIIEKEGALAAANVLPYCEKCNRGVRVARLALESGKKIRVCAKCKSQFDK